MLAIGRALMAKPRLLLLDEPSMGLAPVLVEQIFETVQTINQQGVTIVLTTHYLEEAEQLCDTIAIVNHGQVVACEPTGALLKTLDTRTAVITPDKPLLAPPALGALEAKLTAAAAWPSTSRAARRNGSTPPARKRQRCRPARRFTFPNSTPS